MNIIYLAGSAPAHDLKWISQLSKNKGISPYLLRNSEADKNIIDYKEFQDSGVKITEKKIGAFSISNPLKTFFYILRINHIIRKYNIDLVHAFYAEPHALWLPFLFSAKVKTIITTHGTDILQTIPQFALRKDIIGRIVFKIYKKAFNNADYITCTSEKQANTVKQLFNKAKSPVITRTGINPPLSFDDNSLIEKPYILFPRAMRSLSNHELALKSIAILNKEIKSKYKMVFIDSDSKNKDYVNNIRKLMEEDKDADFAFLPAQPHEKILSLIKNAALAVITNTSDGSPVTAMEAMYFKTPLILPPLDYDKELFGEGVFFFDEWKPESLKEKIESTINLPKEKMNKNLDKAYNKVMEFGNFEKEMQKVENIIMSLSK